MMPKALIFTVSIVLNQINAAFCEHKRLFGKTYSFIFLSYWSQTFDLDLPYNKYKWGLFQGPKRTKCNLIVLNNKSLLYKKNFVHVSGKWLNFSFTHDIAWKREKISNRAQPARFQLPDVCVCIYIYMRD